MSKEASAEVDVPFRWNIESHEISKLYGGIGRFAQLWGHGA
jgi:hypothetical protein